MQKLKLLIPLALFIGAFFVACHEEDPFENGKTADVTFAGRIIDENGDALEGALVKAGEESTITDANGIFRLQSVRLPASHAMVSVSKAGFFEISRPYIVEDDALQTVTIQLLTKNQVGLLIAAAGGVVNVPRWPQFELSGQRRHRCQQQRLFRHSACFRALPRSIRPQSWTFFTR